MSRQVVAHKHKASDIVETQDDYLLPYLRSLRDPSKIERTIIEGSEPLPEGTAFPTEPYEDQLFRLTQDIESYPKGLYRWSGSDWEFVSTVDLDTMDGQVGTIQIEDDAITLPKMPDGVFTGVDGLAKFVEDFFGWDKITGSITGFWGAVSDRTSWLWADITKTFGDICTTLGSWTNMVTELGNLAWAQITKTAGDICDTLVSWAGIVAELGSLAWGQISGNVTAFWGAITDRTSWTWGDVTKSAAQVMGTIASWANIIAEVGNLAWANLSKTAANIMTTIASWTNIIAQVGSLAWTNLTKTYQNICATLGSWANVVTELGSLAWSQLAKTATNIMETIASWANIIATVGNLAWANLTKTASNIMTTIASWANILTQVGGLTSIQVTGVLTSWSTVIDGDGLGNLAWAYITKTAANVMNTIASWANIIAQVGNLAWANLTKTASNIMSTISTWANIISQVGDLAWANLTKTATNILNTIGSWANIVSNFGNLAWSQVTKSAANILSTLGAISAAAIQGLLTSWAQLTGGTALGDFTAGEGDVILDSYGITFVGETIRFQDINEVLRGTIFGVTTGCLSIYAPDWILMNPGANGVKFNTGPIFPGTDMAQALGKAGASPSRWKYYVPRTVIAQRPTNDIDSDGLFWRTREADPNDKDVLWICLRNDAGDYEWVQLAIST